MDDISNEPDTEEIEWMPTSLKVALNKEQMPVILFDDDIKEDIEKDCLKCKDVGLTCISKGKGENSFLICITTEDKIYVIDSKYEEHVAFLERLLKKQNDCDLNFYIYKGYESAFRLLTGYGIDLGNTTDISALDVFLSTRKYILSGMVGQYTVESLYNQRFRYRDRTKLAQYHLGIELPDITREEKADLCKYPLSCKAQNYIRKMAATTRIIALSILQKLDALIFLDSDHIYSFGACASDEAFEAFESLDDKSYQKLLSRLNKSLPQDQ